MVSGCDRIHFHREFALAHFADAAPSCIFHPQSDLDPRFARKVAAIGKGGPMRYGSLDVPDVLKGSDCKVTGEGKQPTASRDGPGKVGETTQLQETIPLQRYMSICQDHRHANLEEILVVFLLICYTDIDLKTYCFTLIVPIHYSNTVPLTLASPSFCHRPQPAEQQSPASSLGLVIGLEIHRDRIDTVSLVDRVAELFALEDVAEMSSACTSKNQ
jgi:hypothetical protein